MSRTSILQRILLGVVAISACGGGDGVTPPPPPPPSLGVATIEVTGAGLVAAGGDIQLSATARNSAGAPMAGISFTWQSSTTTVATVSNAGVLHGVAAGAVTVTARADGKSGTLPVTVRDTASLPATLTGKIERVDLTIPANQTFQVTGNTALVVDSTFILAGTLQIQKGASLTLYGGKLLQITGILDGDSASEYVIGGGRVELIGDTPLARISGGSGSLLIKGRLTPDGPIYLAPDVLILAQGAVIRAGQGRAGTSEARDGGKGHNIEIGTTLARAKSAGNTGRPNRPMLRLEARLFLNMSAGLGGNGFSVTRLSEGAESANTWTGRGGNGGAGGDLLITATDISFSGGNAGPGEGGDGGSVTLIGGQKLKDGSGLGGEGESLAATTGNAGNGGNLVINATTVVGHGALRLGEPGGIGQAEFEGGNGFAGGDGGNFVITVGNAGSAGTAMVPAGISVVGEGLVARSDVVLRHAINGGNSAAAQQPGGRGGFLSISRAGDLPALHRIISLTNVGNGGLGFDGCIEPRVNGTRGGAGGVRELILDLNHPLAGDVEENLGVFDGGNGGHGLPEPGAGGERGHQTSGPGGERPIGAPGLPGTRCPPGTPTLSVFFANPDGGVGIDHLVGDAFVSGPRLFAGAMARPVSAAALQGPGLEFLAGYLGSIDGVVPPGLAHVTVEGNQLQLKQTISRSEGQFNIMATPECILTTEFNRGFVASYRNPAGGQPFQFVGEIPVPGANRILPIEGVDGVGAVVQTTDDFILLAPNPATCEVSQAGPAFRISNIRGMATRLDKVYAVSSPLTGPSTLNAFTVTPTGIQGPTATLTLPNSTFDVATDPDFSFLYTQSGASLITAIAIGSDGAMQNIGQFSRTGADRLSIVFSRPSGQAHMFWNNVANFSEGGICHQPLSGAGLPIGNVSCTTSTEWTRPHSWITLIEEITGQAPAPLRTRGRRAPH